MENEILENLNTKFMGKNIIYYDVIDSTHKEAKKIVKNDVENGTIIVANMQTNGIGTNDRIWYTKKGENITFNLILYPNCDINKIKNITIIMAECILKAIKKLYDVELNIKKPNDVMYKGKKLAGILTGSSSLNGIVQNIIIGIGINVNQTEFTDDIKNIATSLKSILKKECSREKIIAEFLNFFEKEYLDMI